MRTSTTNAGLTFLLLILSIFGGFAQEIPANSIGEEVYNEYKANGIESAVSKYQKLKGDEKYDLTQGDLNLVGYKLMNEDKDLDAAEKIFKLNMEEHPENANPYDSYGDFLLEKGSAEEAKEYFKRSAEMSKVSDDDWEKNFLYPMTMSKMATMDKKHKQMDFLLGDWNIDATAYEDGKEVQKINGKDKIEFNKETNSIFLRHFNEQNEPEGVRIITYDAIDDEFDVAFLNADRLRGIEVSQMKMTSGKEDQYEFLDIYTPANGEKMELKHEIKKISESELDWVIFEKNDNDEWQRLYAMNMTK